MKEVRTLVHTWENSKLIITQVIVASTLSIGWLVASRNLTPWVMCQIVGTNFKDWRMCNRSFKNEFGKWEWLRKLVAWRSLHKQRKMKYRLFIHLIHIWYLSIYLSIYIYIYIGFSNNVKKMKHASFLLYNCIKYAVLISILTYFWYVKF